MKEPLDYIANMEYEEPETTTMQEIGFWLTVAAACIPPVTIILLVLWLIITVE